MKVSVIGQDALASLFAARLSRAGVTATLVSPAASRKATIELRIDSDSDGFEVAVDRVTSVPAKQDLVIVLAKSHETASLELPNGTPVLSLQTGLTNVDTLCDVVNAKQILAGATYEAAHAIEDNVVRHVAPGITQFGAWTTCGTDAATDALDRAGFEYELTDAPGQAIWERASVAAGVEPLTALLRVPNGHLLETRTARQLLRDLVVEAAKVAAVEGYRFEYSLVERAEEYCGATAALRSAMLCDVEAGRRTEIESIGAEIMHRAERAGLPVPRTRVLWQLISSLPNA